MDGAAAHSTQPIAALVANDGTAAFVGAMLRADATTRDLADAVHALCFIHCHQPGVLDHAVVRAPAPVAAWLGVAADAFRGERAYLARLTSVVGPIPSTPGQADAELALLSQRHALEMLARSDRVGCAFGAAAAFVLDWHAIRRVLDRTADRLGVAIPALHLPSIGNTSHALEAASNDVAIARAAAFGAQQFVAQHRGLWHLLEARIVARRDY